MMSRLLFLRRHRSVSSAAPATSAADVADEIAALLAARQFWPSVRRAEQFLRSEAAGGASEDVTNLYRAVAAATPRAGHHHLDYLSSAASALIEASTRAPHPDGALRLLDLLVDTPSAPPPSASSCHALMGELLSLGRHADARRVFERLVEAGRHPGPGGLNTFVQACVMAGDLDDALRRLRELGYRHKRIDVDTCGAVIAALWSAGRGADAAKVFDEMAEMGVEPNLSTYIAMVGGYLKTGNLNAALELWIRMQVFGGMEETAWRGYMLAGFQLEKMLRTLAEYDAVVDGTTDGCLETGIRKSASVWTDMMKWRPLSEEECHTLQNIAKAKGNPPRNKIIEVCIMADDVTEAVRRLRYKGDDGMARPDASSYTMVIDALWHAGRGDEALKLFKEMADMDVVPDDCTYKVMIRGHLQNEKCNHLDAALELKDQMMQQGFSPDLHTYTALVAALCLAERLGDASALFCEVLTRGETPTTEMYDALICLYCKREDLEGAFSLCRQMVSHYQLQPRQATYEALMGACVSKNKSITKWEEVVEEFEKNGISTDALVSRQSCLVVSYLKETLRYRRMDSRTGLMSNRQSSSFYFHNWPII